MVRNNYGTMFGGEVLALMDKAGGIAALRFCRQPVVTASTEHIDFRTPIHSGEIIEAIAKVIYVGRTSLIVGHTAGLSRSCDEVAEFVLEFVTAGGRPKRSDRAGRRFPDPILAGPLNRQYRWSSRE
jgi:acyl-CoA hydrolase